MTFIEEAYNTRIAATALWPANSPPVRWGIGGAGELDVPMAGNSGARHSQPCSNLIGFDRICLHFNPGWQPIDLPEGSFVHNMRRTCADRKLKTVVGRNRGDESEGIG
jgi:hypothetical protein